jgi:AraC family transcriptional regulator of adaptative response/methylated-DNA-[protein]-cysteine methyltransferase
MNDIASMEYIRYSWGMTSLGPTLAAWGDGIVHFEFVDEQQEALQKLHKRFTDCLVIEDIAGFESLNAQLAHLIDHPNDDPGIALDLRGSDFEKRVWNILREIPAGTTVSYGELAAKLGVRDVREVTAAIAANNVAVLVPCHRVIKKDGSISGYRWGVQRKRVLLDRERRSEEFKLAS